MFSRNAIMATLVILSLVLLKLSTTNAVAISNEKSINDVQEKNYTISGDYVILHSLIGDINVPIPEEIKTELNDRKLKNNTNGEKLFERLTLYGDSNDINMYSKMFVDFVECRDQAQIALYTGENYRNWEAFFKRNKITDTMAVRYCCNSLEFAHNAEMILAPECRNYFNLLQMFLKDEAHATCRKYEFNSPECFLVRWMYWWIPIVILLLIGLSILFVCCAMKSRRNKSYLRARQDEKKTRTSLVNGTGV